MPLARRGRGPSPSLGNPDVRRRLAAPFSASECDCGRLGRLGLQGVCAVDASELGRLGSSCFCAEERGGGFIVRSEGPSPGGCGRVGESTYGTDAASGCDYRSVFFALAGARRSANTVFGRGTVRFVVRFAAGAHALSWPVDAHMRKEGVPFGGLPPFASSVRKYAVVPQVCAPRRRSVPVAFAGTRSAAGRPN